MEKTEKIKPVHKGKFGGVKSTVWKNKTDKGVFYNVTFKRSYMDKDGEWQDTDQFRPNDLPKLELAVRDAFVFVVTDTKGGDAEGA